MNQTPSGMPDIGELFLVGDLQVDVGQQRVTRADIDIPLPNLSFQLLLALIRVAPNVLSNDLLMARVWPGLIVSPETVSKRVNLLREALGDNAQDPHYIAGVRSRGYRLVAPVSPAQRPAPAVEGALPAPVVVSQPNELWTSDEGGIEPGSVTARPSRLWWLVLPGVLAAILAISIGVRRANRTHAVRAQPMAEHPLRETNAIGARARTVAVLPFDNISADAADAYLAQGLPEMILNRLSRIDGLSVIARNSSFVLDTKSIDSGEIGRRLNSGYLIGGSVQRDTDRLRVAVHLVDSASGTLVWSAHFDRGLHDIFSMEDEIADQIAGALSVRLGEAEPQPPAGVRSANLEAYLAFLRGRTLLGRFTVAESEAAVPYFERAIALDPNFASSYASLYDARMQAADQRREDLKLARQRYRHLIDRALELDPKLGAAYFARAMWGDEPHDASATLTNPLIVALERDFRQGAALDPSNGRGLRAYAEFLYTFNRTEEGKSVLKRVLWVDPMSPGARFSDAVFSLDESGAKAEQKTLQVLELDPNFVPALLYYGTFRWQLDGKLAEAIQIVEHAIALDPDNPQLRQTAVSMYLDLGDLKAARDVAAGTPTPQNARTTGLLWMHEGDWRRAGLAAYDKAGWTSDDDYCQNWLAGDAIRDYALKTGEWSRAIAFIEQKYYFGDAPAAHLDYCNCRVAVFLSQLMAAAGQADQALALRRAASTWNDANATKVLGGARRLRALVLLLDGKPDVALAELAESYRSGEYAFWWYTIEHDPMWLPLRGDTRFQAIAAHVRRYVDGQRSQLEALRGHGEVPRRGDPATAQAHQHSH